MKPKYFILAFLSATFVSILLNSIYYGVTAEQHLWEMTKETPDWGLMILNHLVYAGLLTYIFPFGYTGKSVWGEGARFGALMGMVMFVPTGLVVRAAWEVPMTPLFALDIAMAAIISAIMGCAIAAIYKRTHAGHQEPIPS